MAGCLALLAAIACAVGLPAVGKAEETGAIGGTVTAEGGDPLESVDVCAYGSGAPDTPIACRLTGPTGEYEITGLPAGRYTVEFAPPAPAEYFTQFYSGATSADLATPVEVTAGTLAPGIDAQLQKPPSGPGKIRGKVIAADTGQPVASVEVCVERVGVAGSLCETTASTGEYAFDNLVAGEWLVTFEPLGPKQNLLSLAYPDKEIWETPTPVTLSPGGEKTINVALKTGGQISGTVRLAATGAPTAGVRVCLTEAEFFASLACLTTPSSGAYRFTSVWPGKFKVIFSAAAGEFPDSTPIADAYSTQWWNGQPTYATAMPITVTPPATVAGIDAALTPISAPLAITPTPSATTASPTAATTGAVAAATAKSKPRKCRSGFARRKVMGVLRCVKVQKHRHDKRKKHHKKAG
jgi:Carboxypeptidase regulatory-like domain